jgi:hypothetical protein
MLDNMKMKKKKKIMTGGEINYCHEKNEVQK